MTRNSKEYQHAYYLKHKERILARTGEYQREHAEQAAEWKKNWNAENPERMAELQSRWLEENREERREYVNAWAKLHPESAIIREHRRRSRELSATGNYTKQEWNELVSDYGGRCAYCNQESDKLTVDHVVPLSRGGTNDISNILPACRSCNSKKNNKSLLAFLFKGVT